MSSKLKGMIALGIQSEAAKAIMGNCNITQASAGSTTADATPITAANSLLTSVASSTGVILPSTAEIGDSYAIGNGGGNTLKVYPHSGGKINDGSADAGISVADGKGALCIRVGTTDWIAIFA